MVVRRRTKVEEEEEEEAEGEDERRFLRLNHVLSWDAAEVSCCFVLMVGLVGILQRTWGVLNEAK